MLFATLAAVALHDGRAVDAPGVLSDGRRSGAV